MLVAEAEVHRATRAGRRSECLRARARNVPQNSGGDDRGVIGSGGFQPPNDKGQAIGSCPQSIVQGKRPMVRRLVSRRSQLQFETCFMAPVWVVLLGTLTVIGCILALRF